MLRQKYGQAQAKGSAAAVSTEGSESQERTGRV